MKTCKVCGKKIPKTVDYCSKECEDVHKSLRENKNPPFLSQFDKGYGSARREANIKQIIQMLESGVDEDEIRFQLSMYFRPMTIDDYLKTAKEWRRRASG